jgi:hypothetical protein
MVLDNLEKIHWHVRCNEQAVYILIHIFENAKFASYDFFIIYFSKL